MIPTYSYIEFDHVSFSGPATPAASVDDVSFRVRCGEMLAVLDVAGAARATVGALLRRHEKTHTGNVRIGGIDTSQIDADVLGGLIHEISADTVLAPGTIADNLLIGLTDRTAAQMREAARAAGLADFIEALPARYETQLAEAPTLSLPAQRQRVAIARALLKHAPILVVNEATSNVDARTEASILATLRGYFGATTLVIAHSPRVAQHAEQVVVLEHGRVVEQGAPYELLAAQGVYAKLCQSQDSLQ